MSSALVPIFDGHNDTLLSLYRPPRNGDSPRDFFTHSDKGHIDLPRAQEGGLAGGFFAIFPPSPAAAEVVPAVGATGAAKSYARPLAAPVEQGDALQVTVDMAALLFRLERQAAGAVQVVRTLPELQRCLNTGTLAMVFHIEGAEAIDRDLNALEVLYQAGLRSLGITWSRANIFGTGVPFQFPQSPDVGPGLSKAGVALVQACNRLGVLIDLSHLNEKGFWDVEKQSDAPLVATHSGAHALCPSARNLTDKQLDAIRASDGVVGVNYHVGFLRADGRSDVATSLSEIVRHVNYMVERMGIDHVALGSDFDGATMPGDLGDVAGLPRLVAALRAAGYDDGDLRKIGTQNWLRALGQTWHSPEDR
ncbi:MAG: dipeptidase [Caldilineaceae bacterium]|nr:dipeptidase [Caldilineaceae bacterium]